MTPRERIYYAGHDAFLHRYFTGDNRDDTKTAWELSNQSHQEGLRGLAAAVFEEAAKVCEALVPPAARAAGAIREHSQKVCGGTPPVTAALGEGGAKVPGGG